MLSWSQVAAITVLSIKVTAAAIGVPVQLSVAVKVAGRGTRASQSIVKSRGRASLKDTSCVKEEVERNKNAIKKQNLTKDLVTTIACV